MKTPDEVGSVILAMAAGPSRSDIQVIERGDFSHIH